MEPMQITDIKIRKFFDEGPMKAIVSVTLNDCLAVHDIKVIYARDHAEAERIAFREFPEYHEVGAYEMEN